SVRQTACWGAGRCAAVGDYTDEAGDGEAALWTLKGTHWTVRRAPLPADRAGGPEPLSPLLALGSSGLCAAYARDRAHRNGSDVHAPLLWTLAGGSWKVSQPPVPGDADPGFVNVVALDCAGSRCAAEGNYSSTSEDNSVLWTGSGSGW